MIKTLVREIALHIEKKHVKVYEYTSVVFHIFTKGNNFHDMFASLEDRALPKGSTLE